MAVCIVVICPALGFLSISMDSMVVLGQEHDILVLIKCDFNHYSFSLFVVLRFEPRGLTHTRQGLYPLRHISSPQSSFLQMTKWFFRRERCFIQGPSNGKWWRWKSNLVPVTPRQELDSPLLIMVTEYGDSHCGECEAKINSARTLKIGEAFVTCRGQENKGVNSKVVLWQHRKKARKGEEFIVETHTDPHAEDIRQRSTPAHAQLALLTFT